jgi:hypothetical protein
MLVVIYKKYYHIPELFRVGYITNKISSDSGPKFVILHEDTQEGTVI